MVTDTDADEVRKLANQLLQEIVELSSASDTGVDFENFCAKHGKDMDLLDAMMDQGVLAGTSKECWVPLCEMTALNGDLIQSIFVDCKKVFHALKIEVKRNSRVRLAVKQIAELAGLPLKRAGECMAYIHFTAFQHSAGGKPGHPDFTISKARKLLKFESLDELIANQAKARAKIFRIQRANAATNLSCHNFLDAVGANHGTAPPMSYRPRHDRVISPAPSILEQGQGSKTDSLHQDAWLIEKDLAKMYDLSLNAVRGRLKRYRKKTFEGWSEADNPRRNEPKYLYRVGAVDFILKKRPTNRPLDDQREK